MIHDNGVARPGTMSQNTWAFHDDVCTMFENPFKKDLPLVTAATTAPKKTPAPAPGGAQTSAGISADELQAWRDRILAANSDDAALLQLAQQAPGVGSAPFYGPHIGAGLGAGLNETWHSRPAFS